MVFSLLFPEESVVLNEVVVCVVVGRVLFEFDMISVRVQ